MSSSAGKGRTPQRVVRTVLGSRARKLKPSGTKYNCAVVIMSLMPDLPRVPKRLALLSCVRPSHIDIDVDVDVDTDIFLNAYT